MSFGETRKRLMFLAYLSLLRLSDDEIVMVFKKVIGERLNEDKNR